MPLTLNGTTGIAGVDGSASTPSVQGTDTNTGLFYPAADTVAIGTGGSERLRVDSSGNVGIGTSAPAASLSVVKQTTALSGTSNSYGLYMYPTSSGLTYIDAITNSTGNTSLGFRTYNNGTYNEMRMDSSGNVGIGTTTPSTKLHVVGEVTATQGVGGYPAFNAYASAAQTVTSTVVTKIAIDTENFDTNSNFNTTNNRFTPTVEGYYQVNGTVLGTGATTFSALLVFIYKNGVNIRRTGIVTPFSVGNNSQVSVSEVIYMNGSTDYIELYGQVNGTGTLQFAFSSSVTTSTFSACLVRGA